MATRIYVGNLPFTSTEQEVREAFEIHGPVHEVKLVNDRETGRPRGFGFVAMDDDNAATAIRQMNQTNFGGRTIVVNVAKERGSANNGRTMNSPRDRDWS